jgi:hypothetical protein
MGHRRILQPRDPACIRTLTPTRSKRPTSIRTTKAHLNVLIEMGERHLRDSHRERPS